MLYFLWKYRMILMSLCEERPAIIFKLTNQVVIPREGGIETMLMLKTKRKKVTLI